MYFSTIVDIEHFQASYVHLSPYILWDNYILVILAFEN